MKRKIRILIVDDHFIVRIGLLTTIKIMNEVGYAGLSPSARQWQQNESTILIVDCNCSNTCGW